MFFIWLLGALICASASPMLPSVEVSAACPADTVNYDCTVGNANQLAISWLVSCHSSPSQTTESCASDSAPLRSLVATLSGAVRSETPCDGDAAILFTFNFVQGVSNLSIAVHVPRNTMITHLEIACESSSRCLHIRGKAIKQGLRDKEIEEGMQLMQMAMPSWKRIN